MKWHFLVENIILKSSNSSQQYFFIIKNKPTLNTSELLFTQSVTLLHSVRKKSWILCFQKSKHLYYYQLIFH